MIAKICNCCKKILDTATVIPSKITPASEKYYSGKLEPSYCIDDPVPFFYEYDLCGSCMAKINLTIRMNKFDEEINEAVRVWK